MENQQLRVWIDTDIGDDVDDALAIALAAKSPELELVGVSTVYRNTPQRSRLARKLLDLLGLAHVPVATGTRRPLCAATDIDLMPYQCAVLNDADPPPEGPHAVEQMLRALKADPKMVLVGIGPYTNLALAVRLAPELMARARIVLMGGAFGGVYPEWNILCDPEAADILLKSGARIEMVGLDVTAPCVLSPGQLEQMYTAGGEAEALLAEMTRIWMDTSRGKKVTLHDPLTIMHLIWPQLIEMRAAPVAVERGGTLAHAATVVQKLPFYQRTGPPPDNVLCGCGVKPDMVCRLFMERLYGTE